MTYEPNALLEDTLRHGSGTTGVTDWAAAVYLNGALISDVPVTITEIASGKYKLSFTPNAEGNWYLDIISAAAPTVHYEFRFQVWSIYANIGGIGYDSRKHSLKKIKDSCSLIRNDQMVTPNGKET